MKDDHDAPAAKPARDATLAEFGARLRVRRKKLRLSQEAAAARAGIHWTGYSRAERGQVAVRIHLVLKLAQALETTPGKLLDGLPLPDDEE